MEKIRSWIIRHRDQTFVSYSRFGKPGEEEDDRPPPTSIYVANFDDNAPEFMFFNCWHVQKAMASFACFGMAMVIMSFLSAFFEFDWYHHERGADLSALLGLFTYLAIGVLIHYYVLYGIKKQMPYYFLPFIIAYSVMCTSEFFFCLALTFKLMDNSQMVSNFQVHPSVLSIFAIIFITIVVQAIMLTAALRSRQYISLKNTHDLELKVAEKSRAKNPSIQIVIASSTTVNGDTANNAESLDGVITA